MKNHDQQRTSVLFQQQFRGIGQEIKKWFQQKDWQDIGFKSSFFIFLVAVGILVRLLLAYSFRVNYAIIDLEIVWNRAIMLNPNNVPLEGYMDFDYYYVSWVKGWYENSWYPFPDWQLAENSTDPLYYYSYPPLFLYILLSFWRPGRIYLYIALPLILTDAACAGMVFLIIHKALPISKRHFFATGAGLLMALAPINIIYNGVYWLNTGPVALFTLIALYFVLKNKWRQVFFWLAIATLTKQNALFLTYPLFMVMLGRKVQETKVKKALFESGMIVVYFLGIFFLGSIPWLFITPIYYGVHLLFPGKMLSLSTTILTPNKGEPVTFSFAMKFFGIKGAVLDGIAFGINSMFLMILSANILAIPLLWRSSQGKNDSTELFSILAIYMIATHIFMPKGVFKFYSAYFTPEILVAILLLLGSFGRKPFFESITLALTYGLFIGVNLGLLIINRYLTPVLLFFIAVGLTLLIISRNVILRINYRQKKTI
ncbi:MAG: hypothetical protein K9W42_11460 [Candidatus Heimdallarchaeota archaeon]|nr:hypothetical protein [Candidatus Heimdallarchaeota archaeon]